MGCFTNHLQAISASTLMLMVHSRLSGDTVDDHCKNGSNIQKKSIRSEVVESKHYLHYDCVEAVAQ
jgi:hypothetical protein